MAECGRKIFIYILEKCASNIFEHQFVVICIQFLLIYLFI